VAPVGWLDPPRFSAYFGEPGATTYSPFAPGGWAHQYPDFAFKLYGEAVPEPGALVTVDVALVTLLSRWQPAMHISGRKLARRLHE
jgi:hypothetical protein